LTDNSQSVLVTGVTGFLGRYVARYFSEQGWSVIGISKSQSENAPALNLKNYYSIHLPDKEFNRIVQDSSPQVCIHCAGRASVGLSVTDPAADFYNNTILTFEILNALRLNAPSCRFIFLSSAAVYGNPESLPLTESQLPAPISPYGFHKYQSEQLCLEFAQVYGLSTASVRIFSAYGPGLRRQVLWDICQKAISQKSLNLQGTGTESRDFIHALDVTRALMLIANSAPMKGEVYNLGTGQEVSITELLNMILNILEYKVSLQFDGIVPVGTPLNWQADISKLKALGFNPQVSLERGVKAFVNWCIAELVGF
jgi:UDP-glucose 4-epimerase